MTNYDELCEKLAGALEWYETEYERADRKGYDLTVDALKSVHELARQALAEYQAMKKSKLSGSCEPMSEEEIAEITCPLGLPIEKDHKLVEAIHQAQMKRRKT